jgi:mannose-1-phosphate guanylyltransferase/mannose-6-phosphate isomerase
MVEMNNLYVVILAGGNGERLWPLSRHQQPKQLIPFLNKKSLLEQTIERVSLLVDCKTNIIVVTNKDHYQAVEQLVGKSVGWIIAEEAARNTAPAILLACHHISQQDENALIVVVPSDAYIPERNAFCKAITYGIEHLTSCHDIAMFGLKPTYAATGYGYLQADSLQPIAHDKGYKIIQFHEKPNKINAQAYIQRNDMFWNIGIFAASVKTFIHEFTLHSPSIATGIEQYFHGKSPYTDLPNISIDYAVIEKSKNVVVFPVSFEWYDVGNLHVFLTLQAKYSPDASSVINFNGTGNLASTKQKLAVCVGVSDLCIIETDDVILVTQKDSAEDIKKVLPQVKIIQRQSI